VEARLEASLIAAFGSWRLPRGDRRQMKRNAAEIAQLRRLTIPIFTEGGVYKIDDSKCLRGTDECFVQTWRYIGEAHVSWGPDITRLVQGNELNLHPHENSV